MGRFVIEGITPMEKGKAKVQINEEEKILYKIPSQNKPGTKIIILPIKLILLIF